MKLRGKKFKSPKVLLVMGAIFLLVGVSMGFKGTGELLDARSSSEWPTVSGKVLSSEIRTQRSSRSRKSRGRTGSSRSKTTHRAEIGYEYTVDGQRYTSDRVLFGGYSSSDSSHAQEVLDRYPKGKQVSVHYDPTQPDRAVLEPGVTGSIYVQLGGAGLFTLVGAGICFAGLWVLRAK